MSRAGVFNKHSLFISGLNWRSRKVELLRHFEQYGKVRRVFLVMNDYTGMNAGRAFVKFDKYDAFVDACKNKNQIIDGFNVNIKAMEDQARIGNMNVSVDTSSVTMKSAAAEDLTTSTTSNSPIEELISNDSVLSDSSSDINTNTADSPAEQR